MRVLDLDNVLVSLARSFAGQAMAEAARGDAGLARILAEFHGMAPNPRSQQRFAARLRGVVSARALADGLLFVLHSVMTMDLRKDGAACFSEGRIAWTRVTVRRGKLVIGLRIDAVQATRHVLQRRVLSSVIGKV